MSNKKEIKKDLDTFKKFEVMSNSDGGKALQSLCLKDIINSIDVLANKFQTATHIELISQCVILKERLSMYRLLKNSKNNVLLAEEALKEALESEEE